uniref:POP1 domain-containing protein n=1 Tax=Steinernema glaseri TaxID=37863 RepID=A0A1I7ZS00_9BILA
MESQESRIPKHRTKYSNPRIRVHQNKPRSAKKPINMKNLRTTLRAGREQIRKFWRRSPMSMFSAQDQGYDRTDGGAPRLPSDRAKRAKATLKQI